MRHLFSQKRQNVLLVWCGVFFIVVLLAACVGGGNPQAGALRVGSGPRWACPSPTPRPYGASGPIKTVEPCNCRTPVAGGPAVCDECPVYYVEWEQEYPQAAGPPFPSPTPYARYGSTFSLGNRVNIGPVFVQVDASAGALVNYPGIPENTQQLYMIHITWVNPTPFDLPFDYRQHVRLRSIKQPNGAVLTTSTWGITEQALEIAGIALPTAIIPSGTSSVDIPVLAPPGTPEVVDLSFLGAPGTGFTPVTPTVGAGTPTPTPMPTMTPTPTGNAGLRDLNPYNINIQFMAGEWRPPGASVCTNAGVMTDWTTEDGQAWGTEILVSGVVAPEGATRLEQIALAQVGKPYVWGAKGPNTFDCSGLATWSYGQIGITIPQGTSSQWPHMKAVDQAHIQSGDLIFFAVGGGNIDHVGLLFDVNRDGQWDLVHAASEELGVRIDYAVFSKPYYLGIMRGFRTAR